MRATQLSRLCRLRKNGLHRFCDKSLHQLQNLSSSRWRSRECLLRACPPQVSLLMHRDCGGAPNSNGRFRHSVLLCTALPRVCVQTDGRDRTRTRRQTPTRSISRQFDRPHDRAATIGGGPIAGSADRLCRLRKSGLHPFCDKSLHQIENLSSLRWRSQECLLSLSQVRATSRTRARCPPAVPGWRIRAHP